MEPTIAQPGNTTTDGNIAFADVLGLIPKSEDGKYLPFEQGVNAGSIRTALGRGSNATIQRNLDEIRRQVAALAAPPISGAVPPAPADAVSAIWSAAWSAAQVASLSRLERVTVERDVLTSLSTAQSQGLAAAGVETDDLREQIAKKEAEKEAAQAQAESEKLAAGVELQQAAGDLNAAKAEIESLKTSIEHIKTEAHNQQLILEKDAQIAAQTMQTTIDRLTDQIGELKSLLHKQNSSPIQPAVTLPSVT